MKKHIKYLIGTGVLVCIAVTSCKKAYFNRPPENALTAGSFYQTAGEVQASTIILYGAPWFGFNGKAFLAVSDLQSGNLISSAGADGEIDPFRNFSEGNATYGVQSVWNGLFTVVAQCNALINSLPAVVPSSVPSSVVNNALGEAHVMRAVAYFYLVRNFGNLPIVTNPALSVGNFQTVPANPVRDVYTFIENDLKFGEANCTPGVAHTGHASSASASAMLAKVYLYEQKYALAKTEAEKVIASGEFGLMGLDFGTNFDGLFLTANNNNQESILAMQWTSNGPGGGYGYGNEIQAEIAPSSTIIGVGADGYGTEGPSFDLQDAFKSDNDVIRQHATIMLPGDHYSELLSTSGGYTVPLNINEQGTHSGVKKYVVGGPPDNGGQGQSQAAPNNTYIMRYSDVYLIEAEAILGIAAGVQAGTPLPMTATTSDLTALKYLNLVRQRAGLVPVANFTYKQLLLERRLEFAIEGDYWYDLQRIDGFNPPTFPNVQPHPIAEAIIAAQNRGGSSGGGTAPNYTDWTRTPVSIPAVDANFLLPIPFNDAQADPNLLKAPVPYKF